MNLVIKLGYIAVATPLRRRRNSGSVRRAVFGLVGVLGVLAFIFSAVSPDDDEIQQEFARGGANFFVGNLERFPIHGETSKVLKITSDGSITTVAIDFSTILGLAIDSKHRLYVLENTTGNPFPTPGTGKVLRIDGKHQYTKIATGLNLPTAMTFGPDGNLYVSNWGFGPPPVGMGEVVKITLPND